MDPDVIFAEETPGWKGYIEWEKYPEKKAQAAAILKRYNFPHPPEFQLGPIPDTNPVLEGVRWKLWHKAIGGPLTNVPELSWDIVLKEKHPDMLHLLQFPYNGESPKVGSFMCELKYRQLTCVASDNCRTYHTKPPSFRPQSWWNS